MTRHFIDVDDLTDSELTAVLDLAAEYKATVEAGERHRDFPDHTLGMVFEKASTRTRVSFETGMTQLGGHAIFLGQEDIQLGRGEPIRDTSRTLSRYVDVVMARLFDHGDIVEFAAYASVPVINGLTDDAHPCQTLADLQTIRERFDGFDGVSAAWVGDANNVGRSFLVGCAMTGIDVHVATPDGYGFDDDHLSRVRSLDGSVTVHDDPSDAVAGVDVIYTDVWISMGQEDEREERLAAFDRYQVDDALVAAAGDDAAVMHCLPAHRGEEIAESVLESDVAAVWDQAENRLHAQKALIAWLLEA